MISRNCCNFFVLLVLLFTNAIYAVEIDIPVTSVSTTVQSGLGQEVINRELAEFWYEFYRKNNVFKRTFSRSYQAKPWVEEQLIARGMPLFIFFVAFIESGFDANAVSKMGAVGPWQFMPATGAKYGLKINDQVDERKDLRKSTKAALDYLEDLHNIFHDWNLAVAAYNAGEFRILEAIRKGKTRDFRELGNLGLLPKETENYLAKIWVVRAMWENYRPDAKVVNTEKEFINRSPASWELKVKNPFPLQKLGFQNIRVGETIKIIKLDQDEFHVVDEKNGESKKLKGSELSNLQ
jgi:hypothetical protein